MQSLRDQLLKTGAISKAQKHRADHEKRRERKQHQKGQFDEITQEQQRQAYEARLEAQRAADRQRAAMQHAQQAAQEQRLQVQHLIDYWSVPVEPFGDQRWYFTTRQKKITYLSVSDPIATQLRTGALAIVERPDDTENPYSLVDHDAAELIKRIDPQYIRFYNTEPADE